LHTVADAVEQVVDVARTVVEALRGEEVGRVVESRIDLVTGGQAMRGFCPRLQGVNYIGKGCFEIGQTSKPAHFSGEQPWL
ncbi:hypothetical protein, partial [Bradyrhizobium sp.]|uniref:hypothetical protein n=1 Tax=Bradyrhizobium sp. TaxID=376 RepID=UPI003BB10627